MNNDWDVVIVGAGAAGYFSAILLAEQRPNWKIAIIEKGNKTLSKVKISGGGRCNITNAECSNKLFLAGYPRGSAYLKPLFNEYGPKQTKDWFERAGLKLISEPDGRMFPIENSSSAVVKLFEQKAHKANISVFQSHALLKLTGNKDECELIIQSNNGVHHVRSRFVILAIGGIHRESVWEPLQGLNISRVPSVPSLFTFQILDDSIKALSGISLPRVLVWLQGDKRRFDGPMLFTHWGLSGPAILKASAFLARELADRNYEFRVHLNLLGEGWNEQNCLEALRLHSRENRDKLIKNAIPFGLPFRLFGLLVEKIGKDSSHRWADLGSGQQRKLTVLLIDFQIECKGKTTFKEEFVTAGGIALSNLQKDGSLTAHPHIWPVGEILDIDGITGGYNFQAAWTTAWFAAMNIAAKGV